MFYDVDLGFDRRSKPCLGKMHPRFLTELLLYQRLLTKSRSNIQRKIFNEACSNCHCKKFSNKANSQLGLEFLPKANHDPFFKFNKLINTADTKPLRIHYVIGHFRNSRSVRHYSSNAHPNESSYNTSGQSEVIPSYIEFGAQNSDLKTDLIANMLIYDDFISEEEENSILEEIEPYMRKLRYEFDHWDDAIHGYRETERRHWTQKNKEIINRVRNLAFPPDIPQLAHVHVLDLKEDGYIKPHVDAVRFCGNTIAGLSLLSSSIMKLVHEKEKDRQAKVLLKQRSLYIMKHSARYDYTHEILADSDSIFRGEKVTRQRRISVIMRNQPGADDRTS